MTTLLERYFHALKNNNGRLDEVALGESIGLSKDNTNKIIDELLKQGKIEFQSFGFCSYSICKMRQVSTDIGT